MRRRPKQLADRSGNASYAPDQGVCRLWHLGIKAPCLCTYVSNWPCNHKKLPCLSATNKGLCLLCGPGTGLIQGLLQGWCTCVCPADEAQMVQAMLTLTLTGQYSRKLFRGLSVGHVFMIMLTYIVCWLLNLLGCSWIWLAGIQGKENSWTQSIGGCLHPLLLFPGIRFVAISASLAGPFLPTSAKPPPALEHEQDPTCRSGLYCCLSTSGHRKATEPLQCQDHFDLTCFACRDIQLSLCQFAASSTHSHASCPAFAAACIICCVYSGLHDVTPTVEDTDTTSMKVKACPAGQQTWFACRQ